MAPMLANCFFFLLFLATVANCQMKPDEVNVKVSIQSKMGAGMTLSVHCRTDFRGRGVPIIDLGEHRLGEGQLYSFTLVQPYPAKLDRQNYHCTFNAQGYPAAVVGVYWGAYFPHWKCECVQGKCPLWTVTPKGFFCGGNLIHTWSQG
ncbi:hypothetical protein M758_9G089200 [Ceratodon purpureus]|nr:hypothetical protein M758_9G089200 [Ceratodon purpureus]